MSNMPTIQDKLQLLSTLCDAASRYDLPPLYDAAAEKETTGNDGNDATSDLDLIDGDDTLSGDFHVPRRTSVSNRRNEAQRLAAPKRKYNTEQAAQTRMIRNELRKRGIDPGPHYKPRGTVKRKWVASGKYRGATLKKGGNLRNFKNMEKYSKVESIFMQSNFGNRRRGRPRSSTSSSSGKLTAATVNVPSRPRNVVQI